MDVRFTDMRERETACGGIWFAPDTEFHLRPYQVKGVEFLKSRGRAMLTDAPGLGKTAQAALAAKPPVWIFAPNYLVEQWYEWLTGEDEKSMERAQGEVVPNVEGSIALARGNYYKKLTAIQREADWTVMNLEMLGTHIAPLLELKAKRRPATVILDESHHLKKHTGKRARAAVEICRDVENVYELTATPIMKEVDDLYMQLRILQPDIFKSYWQFVDKFCIADDTHFGKKILGARKSMLPELEQLLDILRLGRTYKDAGRDLPPVIEKFIKIELPEEARRIYDKAVQTFRLQIEDEEEERFVNYMAMYHRLRRLVTGTFKTEAIGDLLADEVRKTVIFSWYQETAEEIARRLDNDVAVIHGQVKDVAERRRLALGNQHVSATIAALSEGIDLSDARTVIFAEENWTPGSNYQALSRVRRERIGPNADNSEPVVVYYIHCKRTIDEVIHNRSKQRSGTIKEVIREALYL